MGNDEDAWWEERTLPQKIFMGSGFGILGVGFLALVGFVTMSLWNVLMPEIFGLKTITYWQTWGLLILSCIFFKNFGSGSNSSNKRKERKRSAPLERRIRPSAIVITTGVRYMRGVGRSGSLLFLRG